MAGRTFTRPRRTRVYDSNYNAGESYYKSALDGLDRKYGSRSSAPPPEPATNGSSIGSLRASLERERERPQPRRTVLDEDEDLDLPPRRKPNTAALLGEFDSIFDSRKKIAISEKTTSRALKAFTDDADEEFEESMKRVKASRAARAAAHDMEEIDSNLTSRKKEIRTKLNFSNKIIDSVGLNEESGRRKVLSVVSAPSEGDDFARWTAVKSGRRHVLDDDDEESASQKAAVARARKSRARLDDLEAEMQALDERGAAREKRVRDLRSLLSENEANSKETLNSTVRVKSSIQTEKKVVSF